MFKHLNARVATVVANLNPRARRAAAATFLVVSSVGTAMAQSTGDSYDPTADVAKIAAAVVAAIAVSVAFTTGHISIKGSKLPRRGA